jgi:hypothetical protein
VRVKRKDAISQIQHPVVVVDVFQRDVFCIGPRSAQFPFAFAIEANHVRSGKATGSEV